MLGCVGSNRVCHEPSVQGATHVVLEPQKLDPQAAILALPPSVQQLIFKPPEIDGLYRYIVAGSVSRCPEVTVDLSRVPALERRCDGLAAEPDTLQVCELVMLQACSSKYVHVGGRHT